MSLIIRVWPAPALPSLDALAAQIAKHGEQILQQDWSHWHTHFREELAAAGLWLPALVTDFRTLNRVVVASLALGENHTLALATIAQRDEQLASLQQQLCSLGELHTTALDTLRVRDAEIERLDERLKEEGEAHGYAIRIVEQRDHELKMLQGRLSAIAARPLLRWFINRFVTEL